MNWSIQIPYRDRSDPLSDVADAVRELSTDEERAVARKLVLGELVGGPAKTVGEFMDKLEAMSPGERRKMLDAARVKAGLPTTTEADAHQHVEQATHAGSVRAANENTAVRLAYAPSGAIIDLNEADDDAARAATAEESRRQRREQEQGVRDVEADQIRASEQAQRALRSNASYPRASRRDRRGTARRRRAGDACARCCG